MRPQLLLLALAACTSTPSSTRFSDGGPDVAAVTGMTYGFAFDGDGAMPAPWFDVLGDWRIEDGAVVQRATFGDPDFPRVLFEGLQFADLKLGVKCHMEQGSTDRACGLVFRAEDSENYFITRANALEGNVRLYRVVDGDRQQIASASRDVTSNTWHTLEVEATGNHLVVSWNGEAIIDTTDDTFARGVIGMWTKADSITRFDDLTAIAR